MSGTAITFRQLAPNLERINARILRGNARFRAILRRAKSNADKEEPKPKPKGDGHEGISR